MTKKDNPKLDNPVWFALSETHQAFAVAYKGVKFYHPDYCPFGGFDTHEPVSSQLEAYAARCDPFFIVGNEPLFSGHLAIKKELICLQMVLYNQLHLPQSEPIIALGEEHADALFQLVNLVQPGYFRSKTFRLGNYFGIFKNGELIAAAGERMQMNDFVEISAIVTHPDHTRRGYAKQLTAHVANYIFAQNKTPFLHVVKTNTSAIQLYETLGFRTRREMSFWQISTSIL